MRHDTLLNHPPLVMTEDWNPPLTQPIYQSVKFTTDTWEDLESIFRGEKQGFVYSRVSNPTVRQLELLLARMQGRDDSIALGSGVAAISTVLFGLLKAGDHVILFIESYKPTRWLVGTLLAKFGVRFSLLSIHDHARIEAEMKTNGTRLMIFESPTNPMLHIADLEKLTGLARANGVTTVMDNTFAGIHSHGGYPVDIYLHSLTKFAAGHGDVLAGAIIADSATIHSLREYAFQIGASLDPHAAFLVLRGLKTYMLRYRQQCENALEVARFLSKRSDVSNVLHPGLESHPQHELAGRQQNDFGAVVSFDLAGEQPLIPVFMKNLKLFRLAASLGSTESVLAPCLTFYGSDLGTEELRKAGISKNSVRLSIGIEDAGDLIRDLDQALAACHRG